MKAAVVHEFKAPLPWHADFGRVGIQIVVEEAAHAAEAARAVRE